MDNTVAIFAEGQSPGSAVGAPCYGADSAWSSAVNDVVRQLSPTSPRYVACAPALINLMGGLSELAGGSTVYAPLGNAVCVGAQSRTDGKVQIVVAPGANGSGRVPPLLDVADLCREPSAAERQPADDGHSVPTQRQLSWVAEAALAGLRSAGLVRDEFPGVSLFIQPGNDLGTDTGLNASTAAAVMVAVSSATGAPLDAAVARDLFTRTNDSHAAYRRLDTAACLSALFADAETVICSHGLTAQIDARVRLAKDVAIIGIDSGVLRQGLGDKWAKVRAATHIGKVLTDRIMRHDTPKDRRWDGRLASVSAAEYVERLRDRIPTKLKGSEFLTRFGSGGDESVVIESGALYKVRSRTEHHIYEEVRTRQLLESLAAATKQQQSESWLTEAGEALYASHWSYGQRCGLGSVETDSLVNLLRAKGPQSGIYGAKVTGYGCGGLVAVLLRDGETAQCAVAEALTEYQRNTGLVPRVFRGSTPGALVRGAQPI